LQIIEEIRLSSSSVRLLEEPYRTAAVKSYQSALHTVFLAGLGVSIVSLISSAFIEEPDYSAPPKPTIEDGIADEVNAEDEDSD
jgi:hypothetical protein